MLQVSDSSNLKCLYSPPVLPPFLPCLRMLPESTRNLAASQTTAWLLYAFHQFSVWWTIFVAQREYNEHGGFVAGGVNGAKGPKYTRNIR